MIVSKQKDLIEAKGVVEKLRAAHRVRKEDTVMKHKIGFWGEADGESASAVGSDCGGRSIAPRKSLVRVYFPERNMTLTYYNDAFDLLRGDIVYVDGKLEGLRGRVVEVSYTFKIKASDYKRVIGLADTDVRGEFNMSGSHFITFSPTALPFGRVRTWFKAPDSDDEEYVSGCGGTAFCLNDLSGMNISQQAAERGREYYLDKRVSYLCLDGTRGSAIVEGTQPYELEFEYRDGEIRDLVCGCFCGGACKHQFAAMLQLRETLEVIEKNYESLFAASGYFAAVSKSAFFSFVIDGKEGGSFTL